MTLAEGVRIWFIALLTLAILGAGASIIRVQRRRKDVERQVGPLPTPMFLLEIIILTLLLTRVGALDPGSSAGWQAVRVLGILSSLYAVAMVLWSARTLGPMGAPGVAIFRDHKLVTGGPYRLVRHPGYSGIQAMVLGAALGTLKLLILALWGVALVATYVNSRTEDRLLTEKFGVAYEEYARQKSRFFPGIW